ncbi:hypothetical protein G6F37_007895 [Rhizopus arrhizus]|nr:hypothetical protein G6F38_008068 [Rhizopus arrhizus]KAG1156124.1 hypothetical protein G6F37_007895 [Rhizopus arrhizus]
MSNITIQFRQLVEQKANSISPKKAKEKKHEKCTYDLFTKEAYRIYRHVDSLKHFLLSIRPVYLSTSNRPRTTRTRITQNTDDPLFSLLPTNITHLTDNERDEIDFQAKLIIKRCIDRINELEESETIRQANEASKPTHRFAQFLNSVLPSVSSTEDILRVHRSSMTWLLNQQLTQVSKIQKDQQEIRLNREIEKSENQLSRSTAVLLPPPQHIPAQEEEQIELDAFEEMLSKEQMQILEKENSVMLENLNNTLNQIKSAEKALLEISTLQTQLTNHLAAQTLQTDRLYADAVATTETVERGNLQLLSAKERNRGSRRFILAFLIGASFVLLFLDWYS